MRASPSSSPHMVSMAEEAQICSAPQKTDAAIRKTLLEKGRSLRLDVAEQKAWSVHEIRRSCAHIRLFGLLKRKLDPGQADEQDVEAVREEGEEDEPEGSVIPLVSHLVDEAGLVEVEDDLGQVVQLYLRGEQDEDHAGAET